MARRVFPNPAGAVHRRMRCWAWLVAALIATFLVGAPISDAHAEKKRVVLLKFKGRQAKRVRNSVIKVLRRSARIALHGRFARALGDVGSMSAAGGDKLAVTARRLGIHGVVSGKVRRRRGWYILALTLREAASGKIVREFLVELGRKPRLTKRARRIMRREFIPAITDLAEVSRTVASSQGQSDDIDEGDVDKTEVDKTDADGSDADEADFDEIDADESNVGKGRGGDASGAAGMVSSVREPDKTGQKTAPIGGTSPARSGSTRPGGDRSRASGASIRAEKFRPFPRSFDVAVGASMLGRRLSFQSRDVGLAPFDYRGVPVPAARFRGTLYPFALAGADGFTSSLGASFVFERVVRNNSNVEGSAIDIPTTHQRWGVGVHYRIDVGRSGRSPSISIGAGYDQLTFTLDRRVLMDEVPGVDLPDVDYLVFYPTLSGELPLGSRLVLFTRSAFLFISDAGPIENENAYGSGSAYGFDAELGIELWLARRLLIRLAGEYTHISHDFEGDGALRDRDGDGTPDVDGALDQYYGAYLTAGFRF
ncbi:MAG: hypothetical protein MJE77_32250 [Proteobacteria bacterium]|nr:hypothetical protein [Pseudomonadota bacterium]